MAKIVLTGGSGTLGRALIPKLKALATTLTVISRSEAKQLDLRAKYPDVEFLLGDVTDAAFLWGACEGATTIVHAAALKHVPLSEQEPMAYTKVNVVGTIEVVEIARMLSAQIIAISTDKACCPQNVYGLTKLLMERLVVEAGGVCVRYGNVFGSVGSVIPRWRRQLAETGKIQVTDAGMTRFFFPVEEAVAAVLWCMVNAPAGSVVIPPIRAASIGELAMAFLEVAGLEPSGSGVAVPMAVREGEKQHEMLLTAEEGGWNAWLKDRYVVVGYFPAHSEAQPLGAITSDTAERISREELEQWIRAL